MSAKNGVMVHFILFSLLTAVISLSVLFLFLKVMKILSSFSFANGNAKKYICGSLQFTAITVYCC